MRQEADEHRRPPQQRTKDCLSENCSDLRGGRAEASGRPISRAPSDTDASITSMIPIRAKTRRTPTTKAAWRTSHSPRAALPNLLRMANIEVSSVSWGNAMAFPQSAVISVAARATSSGRRASRRCRRATQPGARCFFSPSYRGHDRVVLILARSGLDPWRARMQLLVRCHSRAPILRASSWQIADRERLPRRTTLAPTQDRRW